MNATGRWVLAALVVCAVGVLLIALAAQRDSEGRTEAPNRVFYFTWSGTSPGAGWLHTGLFACEYDLANARFRTLRLGKGRSSWEDGVPFQRAKVLALLAMQPWRSLDTGRVDVLRSAAAAWTATKPPETYHQFIGLGGEDGFAEELSVSTGGRDVTGMISARGDDRDRFPPSEWYVLVTAVHQFSGVRTRTFNQAEGLQSPLQFSSPANTMGFSESRAIGSACWQAGAAKRAPVYRYHFVTDVNELPFTFTDFQDNQLYSISVRADRTNEKLSLFSLGLYISESELKDEADMPKVRQNTGIRGNIVVSRIMPAHFQYWGLVPDAAYAYAYCTLKTELVFDQYVMMIRSPNKMDSGDGQQPGATGSVPWPASAMNLSESQAMACAASHLLERKLDWGKPTKVTAFGATGRTVSGVDQPVAYYRLEYQTPGQEVHLLGMRVLIVTREGRVEELMRE